MLDRLNGSLGELVPKLRDLQRLLAAEATSSPIVELDLTPSARIWGEVLLGVVGAVDEAASHLRQELLAGTATEPRQDTPPGGNPESGDDGGAAVGAGVHGPTPRRGPGAARRFEESDEPPRNP